MDDQSRNLILATALSFLVILGWFLLGPLLFPNAFPPPSEATASKPPEAATQGAGTAAPPAAGTPSAGTPAATPALAAAAPMSRAAALAKTERLPIKTARLAGSLSLEGGRIDDLELTDYTVSVDKGSPIVTLLTPAGAPEAYYALYGWAPAGDLAARRGAGAVDTLFTLESGGTLTRDYAGQAEMGQRRGADLPPHHRRRRQLHVHRHPVGREPDRRRPVRLQPYGIVARHGKPSSLQSFYVLHEGVVTADRRRAGRDQVQQGPRPCRSTRPRAPTPRRSRSATEHGWIGFTDNYWMIDADAAGRAGLHRGDQVHRGQRHLPDRDAAAGGRRCRPGPALGQPRDFSPGPRNGTTHPRLPGRGAVSGRFIDSIDWGWFFFLTKPIFRVLHWLHGFIGNMGWSIIGADPGHQGAAVPAGLQVLRLDGEDEGAAAARWRRSRSAPATTG